MYLKKGETVGYGRTFKAYKPMKIAALAVGYADGFRRAPNNWGHVLCHGEFCPILGRVSMDQTTIDVTNQYDAKVGDEVVLIGNQGKNQISAEDVAASLGTINYEVTTAIASRVTREYTPF
jgi:alanine racemase